MAENVEALANLGARPLQHAESLQGVPLGKIVEDLRLAMQTTDKLAGLRLRIAKIADEAVAVSPQMSEGLRKALSEEG